MRGLLLNMAGAGGNADRGGLGSACWRGFWPLAAPFLILACEPRWELAAAAACWTFLILPGVLAVNVFFPSDHPFGRGLGKLAVASIGGLLLFGLVSWPACLLHLRLSTALGVYAAVYAACVGELGGRLMRRGPLPGVGRQEEWNPGLRLNVSRMNAALIVIGIALVLSGVWLATLETGNPSTTPRFYGARPYWWQGTLLAGAASLAVAAFMVAAARRRTPGVSATLPVAAPSRRRAKRAPKPTQATEGFVARSSAWLAIVPWIGVAALAWHLMNVGYRMPPVPEDRPSHMYRPAWNSDDVSYVSQAVDIRHGLPMGRWESSVGSDAAQTPVDLSPLVAPLVAAVSWATGVQCAALHHAVLCPLVVLLGVSALAATLSVILGMHRWAVGLGTLAAIMILAKSWEYERSMSEFMLWRAVQTKSVHLWLLHPMQLATLVLVACRPTGRHLLWAAVTAVVAYLVHPFATILGAVWSATACGLAIVRYRDALVKLVILAGCYGLLGGAHYTLSQAKGTGVKLSSGRSADDPEQSRDLARSDGRPTTRQDPHILWGWNVIFCLGALAVPPVLAMSRQGRSFLIVGTLGAVAVAICNTAWLGKLVNVALPASILWRARWMVPSLVNVALLSAVLFGGFQALFGRRDRAAAPLRSLLACLATAAVFGVFTAKNSAYFPRLGALPRQLSKFPDDMHRLVEVLGGVEADPFVWGPSQVTRELPQLMPHLKLVLSREKLMRPADHPDFRDIVLRTRDAFYLPAARFRGGRAPDDAVLAAMLERVAALYPIDHVVLDYSTDQGKRGEQGARVLSQSGWQQRGRAGVYEVWQRLRPPQP